MEFCVGRKSNGKVSGRRIRNEKMCGKNGGGSV